MQYSVWSGTRQIGVTDLGFRYRNGGSRTGWFHPSAQTEPLMPQIVVPLIGNYFHPRRTDPRRPMTVADFAQLAAYERACKRAAGWDLHLRREDGSLVPTESVAIRDIEALLACYPDTEDDLEAAFELDEGLDFDEEFDLLTDPSEAWRRPADEYDDDDDDRRALDLDPGDDFELIDDWMQECRPGDQWESDGDDSLPRYQIWVMLSDEAAVP